MARAASGVLPKASIAIGALTTLGAVVFAVSSGASGSETRRVAPLAAGLLAWGAGVLLCFAASMRAFDRDHEDGWDALLARHGARPTAYLVARIVGLALVTLAVVLPGTLLAGVAAALASRDGHVARAALAGAWAGAAYAVAFSAVVAPIALATLGARSRASGYLWLLTVLVLPAIVADWTGQFFPDGWSELVSVPGALDALRESLLGKVDVAEALRAFVVLALIALLASAWARAQLRFHTRSPS
jgi:predicted cation transporter